MSIIKEVTESSEKTYISPHENYTVSLMNGSEKKKFVFDKGKYTTSNPDEISLLNAEFERRYLIKDANGNPALDPSGEKVFGGDMKYLPVNEYEKKRLHQPVQVKVNGKIYELTEADLQEYVRLKQETVTVKSNDNTNDGETQEPETKHAFKRKKK